VKHFEIGLKEVYRQYFEENNKIENIFIENHHEY